MTSRIAGALALSLVVGCGLADFDVDRSIPEQWIPGVEGEYQLSGTFPIPVDLDEEFASTETGPADSIRLKRLTLRITPTAMSDGDADDWSFVEYLDLYVSSTAAGSERPRLLVASTFEPGPVLELALDPAPGVNLLGYVQEGAVLTAEASGTIPPDDVTFVGEIVFRVNPI